MSPREEEPGVKNFYARMSFDRINLGVYVISIPGDVPDDLVPAALYQAEQKMIHQRLRVLMMTEEEYLLFVKSQTTIEKREEEE